MKKIKPIWKLCALLILSCAYSQAENPYDNALKDDDVIVVNGIITSFHNSTYPKDIVIPTQLDGQTITGIGRHAFATKGLEQVHLPATLEYLGEMAFYNNDIKSITIPKNVTTIEKNCFYRDTLEIILFEDNSRLSVIKDQAFDGHICTHIILPDSVSYIGINALQSSQDGFTFNLPIGFDHWKDNTGTAYSAGDLITQHNYAYNADIQYTLTDDDVVVENGTITSCSYGFQASNITIPAVLDAQSITGIGNSVFKGTNIVTLTLPSGLETIGDNAFENTKIKVLNIPESVTNIGNNAFAQYTIEQLDFGSNTKIQSIGDRAFYGNKLSNIHLPTDLNHLGIAAFNGNNITQVNGEDFDGIFYAKADGSIDSSRIVSCGRKLQDTLILHEGLEVIEEEVFRGQEISQVSFPNTLTCIKETAFANCQSLTEIKLGPALVTIEKSAFASCKSISTVNLKACTKLEYIGMLAFTSCESLQSIDLAHCKALSFIGTRAFYRCKFTEFNLPPYTQDYTYSWLGLDKKYYTGGDKISNLLISYTAYKDHVVTFTDWDNTFISSDTVKHAMAANAPQAPSREGYTFDAWDTSIESIEKDTTVQARYKINMYTVSFQNWDNTLISKDNVAYKHAAKAPTQPTRENYTFVKWDTDFTSITKDLTVKAEFTINTYIVSFIDWDNSLIAKDTVEHGATATPPTAPEREDYTFTGWHTDINNITSDQNIMAQYQSTSAIKTHTLSALSVYPNPATSTLVIENEAGNTITLYTLSGTALMYIHCNKDKQLVDISTIKSGIYILKTGIKSNKLIIN